MGAREQYSQLRGSIWGTLGGIGNERGTHGEGLQENTRSRQPANGLDW